MTTFDLPYCPLTTGGAVAVASKARHTCKFAELGQLLKTLTKQLK